MTSVPIEFSEMAAESSGSESEPAMDVAYGTMSGDEIVSLTKRGVPPTTVARLLPIPTATGFYDGRGYFDPHPRGETWAAFSEPDDTVFWHPVSDRVARLTGQCFALNEASITDAATYSFDHNLNVFSTIFDWLRADCDGIVVFDWPTAFDRLRDVPRIAIAEELLPTYRRYMQPRRMPSLAVIPSNKRTAA